MDAVVQIWQTMLRGKQAPSLPGRVPSRRQDRVAKPTAVLSRRPQRAAMQHLMEALSWRMAHPSPALRSLLLKNWWTNGWSRCETTTGALPPSSMVTCNLASRLQFLSLQKWQNDNLAPVRSCNKQFNVLRIYPVHVHDVHACALQVVGAESQGPSGNRRREGG